MKTVEEIEAEIIKLKAQINHPTGLLISEVYSIPARIAALEWVLAETKEEPLTHIELKQLRAIMQEHKEKSKCVYEGRYNASDSCRAYCQTHGFNCPNIKIGN